MTKSKNNYYNDDTRRVHDDCVEGDTVSEGDTSDEEDIAVSKTKRLTRKSSSLSRKKGLELPSGSADDSNRPRANKRKLLCVGLAFAAVVAISAAIGVGVYAAKKNSTASSSPTTTLGGEFATSSSIPISSKQSPVAISSASEDENDSVEEPLDIVDENENDKDSESGRIEDSESNTSPEDKTLGLLDELVDYEDKERSESEDEQEKGSNRDEDPRPTNWPDLVGKTGDDAKAQLELLYGEETYNINVLHENSPVTRDYRFNRIRIFTNDEGIVTKIPHIG